MRGSRAKDSSQVDAAVRCSSEDNQDVCSKLAVILDIVRGPLRRHAHIARSQGGHGQRACTSMLLFRTGLHQYMLHQSERPSEHFADILDIVRGSLSRHTRIACLQHGHRQCACTAIIHLRSHCQHWHPSETQRQPASILDTVLGSQRDMPVPSMAIASAPAPALSHSGLGPY